jgi:hypothetical protein
VQAHGALSSAARAGRSPGLAQAAYRTCGATYPSTTARALGRCYQPHTPPTIGLALSASRRWSCLRCAFALPPGCRPPLPAAQSHPRPSLGAAPAQLTALAPYRLTGTFHTRDRPGACVPTRATQRIGDNVWVPDPTRTLANTKPSPRTPTHTCTLHRTRLHHHHPPTNIMRSLKLSFMCSLALFAAAALAAEGDTMAPTWLGPWHAPFHPHLIHPFHIHILQIYCPNPSPR